MMNKIQFLNLIDEVVLSEFPNHFDIYEFEREEIYEQLVSGENFIDEIPLNKAGVPVSEIIGYISVIYGFWETIKTVLEFPDDLKTIKKKIDSLGGTNDIDEDISNIKNILLKSLLKRGISEERANRIVSKFLSKTNQLLKDNKKK